MARAFSAHAVSPPNLMVGVSVSPGDNASLDSTVSSQGSIGLQSTDSIRTPTRTPVSPNQKRVSGDVDVVAEYYDRQRSNGTGSALQV